MQMRVRFQRRTALKDLLEADVDDVPESGRARRQLGEIQEVGVERIVTGRRRIDRTATLEDAGGILRIEQADHRTAIVERGVAPIFQVAEEVVNAAVGAKILGYAGETGLREIDVLAGRNGDAVIAGVGGAAGDGGWAFEAVQIAPAVGEQRDGIAEDRRFGVARAEEQRGPGRADSLQPTVKRIGMTNTLYPPVFA
jgi:hypothetical protein